MHNGISLDTKHRPHAKREPNWQVFEEGFHARHPHFFRELIRTFPDLTPTEVHVCAMLRESMRSWEIAERLTIAEHTVENHRSNIRAKLGLSLNQNLQLFLLGF